MEMHPSHSRVMKSTPYSISLAHTSVGAFTTAVLLRPDEAKNRSVSVQGELSSWHGLIKILERLQNKKWDITYTSIPDVEAQEKEAWGKGDPSAVRLNLRRCMGTGNAKLDHVDNDLFSDFKATTNLEKIAMVALERQGLL
jgi:hypothetical protein